jgi:hypothetical protein
MEAKVVNLLIVIFKNQIKSRNIASPQLPDQFFGFRHLHKNKNRKKSDTLTCLLFFFQALNKIYTLICLKHKKAGPDFVTPGLY